MNINKLLLALEADDITGEVEKETANITGKSNNTNDVDDGSEGKEDLGKTEDIFGIKENKEKLEKEKKDRGEEDNPDENKDENKANDNAENNEDGNIDPNLDEGGEDPNLNDDNQSPTLTFYDKNKLKNNMILLHNMIDANIKIISELLSHNNDLLTIKVCNMCIANLTNARETLFNILENDLEEKTYELLLKDYLTIKRIYDICAEILDKHFDNIQRELKKKKKSA